MKKSFGNLLLRLFSKFFIIFALFFLVFFIYNNKNDFENYIYQINWNFAIMASILHLLAMTTQTLGWYVLVRKLSPSLSFVFHARVYTKSLVSRRIPLGLLWNIGGRFAEYEEFLPKKTLSVLFFAEYLLIASSGAFLLILVSVIFPSLILNYRGDTLLTISTLFLIVLVFTAIIIKLRNTSVNSIRSLPPLSLSLSFLLFLVTWIIDGMSLHLIVMSLNFQIGLLTTLSFSWIAAFSSFFGQFLPFNTAFKEITLVVMFSQWIPLAASVFIAIFQRVIHTIIEILMAFLTISISHFSTSLQITQR
ncbi:MAG TPA: hypothetical protein DCE76_02720 [Anaerolineaceae bacterium]|nr:hypothetical protein [Anaerolineaceae bacterium]